MIKINLPFKKSLIVVAVLALATFPSYYFYHKYQKSQQLLKDPTEVARQEVHALTQRVSRHIELPEEVPTVATVSDKDKLKDQAFFAKAENGDKVLIYTQTRKAILYRASTDKIIEISAFNPGEEVARLEDTATETAPTAAKPLSVSVVLYNGTQTSGLTSKVEKIMRDSFQDIDIKDKKSAARKDYEKTLVVDISGRLQERASEIAAKLSAELGGLPEGESNPDADILIIVGQDKIP